ncbi:MAG: sulfite exporter TauE/SafE family protein, partial [Pseudomonadota bacterium]
GILCFIFIAHRLTQHVLNKVATEGLPNWLTAILGAMGGFTSFVAHAGSPPVKMVLLSENLPPKEFVGTNSYLMARINAMKLIPYFWLGQLSASNLSVSMQLAPFMVVGIAIGFWLNSRVSADVFTKLIFVALGVIGAKLIWDSAPILFA